MPRATQRALQPSPAARSLAWLRAPNKWPHWPFCPLTNKVKADRGRRLCGVAVEEKAGAATPSVYLGNIFDLDAKPLSTREKMSYGSLEAMIADGWEVD
jgi:hypothetical protein